MIRVFPKNMDPIDAKDEKKAVGILEDYVRYMKEQIEWAINLILTLNGGTSLADLSLKMDDISKRIRSLEQNSATKAQINSLEDEIEGLRTSIAVLEMNPVINKTITTTVDQNSTDDELPTAKAVYDAIGGV